MSIPGLAFAVRFYWMPGEPIQGNRLAISRKGDFEMGPNDVEAVRVYPREAGTDVQDITCQTGSNFEVAVEAEVGTATMGGGGSYNLAIVIRDFSDAADGSSVIHADAITDLFGGADWPAANFKNEFVFTVPAAVITGREGHIMEALAHLETGGVGALPPDVSFCRSPLFTAHEP
jgi:hypothetical protein